MAQYATERQFQIALRERGLERAGSKHGTVNQDHSIAKLRYAAEVVGRYQDQVPLIAQRT
ncbi:hypothetical protein D3C85_1883260 [compost metagenome]